MQEYTVDPFFTLGLTRKKLDDSSPSRWMRVTRALMR
jgi:hypothetical protein